MVETTLRPCPFCEHEPVHSLNDAGWDMVCCSRSDDCVGPIVLADNAEEARRRWNTRPGEDALSDAVSDLVSIVRRVCMENYINLGVADLALFEAARDGHPKSPSPTEDTLVAALEALLRRDEGRTCLHEETHRGGVIWEICEGCGAKWADDEGGKPEWKDPPEWSAVRTLIAQHRGQG